MLDWLSRKLLGAAASAGQMPPEREAWEFLPPGAVPASRLAEPVARLRVSPGQRIAVSSAGDTKKPARPSNVIAWPVAVGLDRPRARRQAQTTSRKTNP